MVVGNGRATDRSAARARLECLHRAGKHRCRIAAIVIAGENLELETSTTMLGKGMDRIGLLGLSGASLAAEHD